MVGFQSILPHFFFIPQIPVELEKFNAAEIEYRDVFPQSARSSFENSDLLLDQGLWTGRHEIDEIVTLQDFDQPIQISAHTMMTAAIFTLLSLKIFRGIPIEVDWRSGSSPEQINRLAKRKKHCDFLMTADAGVHYTDHRILSDFSRLFTCIEETQYVLGKKQTLSDSITSIYVAPKTTQQIQFELWSAENRLPKNKIELSSISDTPEAVANLSNNEALILTRQKSRRFLKEYPLAIIGTDNRGLSFSLYFHNSWKDKPLQLQHFVHCFHTEWNFCRSAILSGRYAEFGLYEVLSRMWNDSDLLNSYSIASDFVMYTAEK